MNLYTEKNPHNEGYLLSGLNVPQEYALMLALVSSAKALVPYKVHKPWVSICQPIIYRIIYFDFQSAYLSRMPHRII